MNSKFMCVVAFSLGAAVGTAVSWRILKTTYEQLAKEQIDSVKERYSSEVSKYEGPQDSGEAEYVEIVSGYNQDATRDGVKKEDDCMSKPRVISPEEFAEIEEYETTSLYYFGDGILAHLNGEVVEDVDELVGLDSLERFGEYEDDSVFVRNDKLKCDFEILRDPTNYADCERFDIASQAED